MTSSSCVWRSGAWCRGMTLALDGVPHNHEGKGLSAMYGLPEPAPAGARPCILGLVYRRKARDQGVVLNRCPWCGAKLREEDPATDPEGPPIAEPLTNDQYTLLWCITYGGDDRMSDWTDRRWYGTLDQLRKLGLVEPNRTKLTAAGSIAIEERRPKGWEAP